MKKSLNILVTGATGYIGGRLVNPLLDEGYTVYVMTRNASHLQGRTWLDDVHVVEGDVLDASTLGAALNDIDVAYYLIHSMGDTKKFAERDKKAAENFARAATDAGVKQIIYLGGLGDEDKDLSKHLESRQEVGEVLRQHHEAVTEFRAAQIIGAGSLSFELIRNLTERLPIMIAPKWLYTKAQPLAIQDVLQYLIQAVDYDDTYNEIIGVGGQDKLTYHDMIMLYAEARDFNRFIIPVPVLTPHLSSYWIHLVTPVSSNIARPLIKGLKNEVVVQDNKATKFFPNITPMTYKAALSQALKELNANEVETSWTDSMAATWEQDEPYTFVEERGMLIEHRVRTVNDVSHADLFRTFTSLGGDTGWLYLDFLWRLRGWMDRVIGGPGYRRKRPHRLALRPGDAVDYWRVEAIEHNKLMRLRAEMKMPGKGWLQYEIIEEDGDTKLTQTAYYAPKGLLGYVYWYAVYILHKLLFDKMIDSVIEHARKLSETPPEDKQEQILEIKGELRT